MSVADFDISPDEREVAFTMRAAGGQAHVWLASVDRRSAPRRVLDAADTVSFGPEGELIVRALGERSNSLVRVKKDGSGRERIGNYAILNAGRTSPDGTWVIASVSGSLEGGPGSEGTFAIPVRGGAPVAICSRYCVSAWSPDGRFFQVTVQGGTSTFVSPVRGRTLAFPVPRGRLLPDLSAGAIPLDSEWSGPEGTRVIDRADVVLGLEPSTYVFVKADLQRNLFRIPLH
jgi:hypothetical protein